MLPLGFKKEFTDFFIEHYDEIMEQESHMKGFISRCYNEFEEVQKTNTSNRGSQRQLKPTVKRFVEFFEENKFLNTTDKTRIIANTIAPYFTSQRDFENAVKIFEEKQNNEVPDNIVNIPLSEKDIFEGIEKNAKLIENLQKDTLKTLIDTANNEFTFEWLSKNDPQNLILGKLCSCCAHLEGAGYGIMHASISHPNVQNLVIRDSSGEIIAKSTLYINPTQRYGVFNNVEVNNQIPEEKLNQIYQKYILGIKTFAENYNAQNPNRPLRQINIGMNLNDIESEIKKYNKRSNVLFQSLNYGDYGITGQNYNGDSNYSQYIVWQNPNEKNMSFEEIEKQ